MFDKTRRAVVLVVLGLSLPAWAGDAVEKALKEHDGKTVTVILHSGTEVTGTVAKVGDGALHLTSLSGKEFFDAVVDLESIQAVEFRAR